jgi:hypothetical protein
MRLCFLGLLSPSVAPFTRRTEFDVPGHSLEVSVCLSRWRGGGRQGQAFILCVTCLICLVELQLVCARLTRGKVCKLVELQE